MLKREIYLNRLIKAKDTEYIKIITGVRRSGKSVILTQFQDYLQEKGVKRNNILYYNFELPRNYHLNSFVTLYDDIKSKTEGLTGKIYFIFDEIQEVEEWQKLVNGLRLQFDCDIYVTGSNANLLSGELATYLSGRYIELEVYPFSFKEYIEYKGSESQKDKEHLFQEYLKFGGFPPLVKIDDDLLKADILSGIYSSILMKDVASRGQVRDIDTLTKLVEYLLDTIGSPISVNNIVNSLKNSGINATNPTVSNYIKLLKDSFIFYEAKQYDIRRKQRLRTNSKFYVVDTGLRNNALKQTTNYGSQLENIIYIELRRRGYEVFVGNVEGKEVDFVTFKSDTVEYIQVTYQMPIDDDREQRNLIHIKDNFKKTIISLNHSDVGHVDGIEITHAIDWLLED